MKVHPYILHFLYREIPRQVTAGWSLSQGKSHCDQFFFLFFFFVNSRIQMLNMTKFHTSCTCKLLLDWGVEAKDLKALILTLLSLQSTYYKGQPVLSYIYYYCILMICSEVKPTLDFDGRLHDTFF